MCSANHYSELPYHYANDMAIQNRDVNWPGFGDFTRTGQNGPELGKYFDENLLKIKEIHKILVIKLSTSVFSL